MIQVVSSTANDTVSFTLSGSTNIYVAVRASIIAYVGINSGLKTAEIIRAIVFIIPK